MAARSSYIQSSRRSFADIFTGIFGASDPRHIVIGGILLLALFAFEMFNFDTTRYALTNLLGDVTFVGIGWASILAIAFCAIDFAGLARLFTPERGRNEPHSVWYLMGAWLLGATMNAVMTWWAVSLTLLNHTLGNEILGREELLQFVPIFVAVLVWLTRILFIGSLTVAGEKFLDYQSDDQQDPVFQTRTARPAQPKSRPVPVNNSSRRPQKPQPRPASSRIKRPSAAMVGFSAAPTPPAASFSGSERAEVSQPIREPAARPTTRIQRRPPVMGGYSGQTARPSLQAKGHD